MMIIFMINLIHSNSAENNGNDGDNNDNDVDDSDNINSDYDKDKGDYIDRNNNMNKNSINY